MEAPLQSISYHIFDSTQHHHPAIVVIILLWEIADRFYDRFLFIKCLGEVVDIGECRESEILINIGSVDTVIDEEMIFIKFDEDPMVNLMNGHDNVALLGDLLPFEEFRNLVLVVFFPIEKSCYLQAVQDLELVGIGAILAFFNLFLEQAYIF